MFFPTNLATAIGGQALPFLSIIMRLVTPQLANKQLANKTRGEYTKVKQVGKGAFGSVFLVTGPGGTTEEPLVLKEVSLAGMSAKERKSTMNEYEVMKKLKHQNIVAFREAFVAGSTLCLVMEYAQAGDLASLIDRQKKSGKRFAEETVWRLLGEMVSALSYCHHELHLLHRDLKPANILLGKGDTVKLGDFGISKLLNASKALAQTQCGVSTRLPSNYRCYRAAAYRTQPSTHTHIQTHACTHACTASSFPSSPPDLLTS